MVEFIVIAAIATVLTHAIGMRVTDSIHAAKGTETPRMKRIQARREDRANGNRHGFGLYMDEAWEAAAARRRKKIEQHGYEPGFRAWLSSKWAAGWSKAIDRHGPPETKQDDQPDLGAEADEQVTDQDRLGTATTIDAALETKDTVEAAFDDVPRDTAAEPDVRQPAEAVETNESEPGTGAEIEVPEMPEWEGGQNPSPAESSASWSPFGDPGTDRSNGSQPEPAATGGQLGSDEGDAQARWLQLSQAAVKDHGLAVNSKDYWVFMMAHTRFGGDFEQAKAEYERGANERAALEAAWKAANSTGLTGQQYTQFVDAYQRFDGDFERAYRSVFPDAFTQEADNDTDARLDQNPPPDPFDLEAVPEEDSPPELHFSNFAENAKRQGLPPRAVDAILDALARGEERIELRHEDLVGGDPGLSMAGSYIVAEKGHRVEAVVVPPWQPLSDDAAEPILSDYEPININQEESMSTTSGETATLPAAQRYGNAMVEQLDGAITATEQSKASLVGAQVTGEPITALAQAMDQLTAAKTAFANFVSEIERHQSVADAHRAVASAGDKGYLLGD